VDSDRNAGTLAALSNHVANYQVTSTAVFDPGTLAALLANNDVFLVPAQSNGNPDYWNMLGPAWAAVLKEFVERGGVIVVCSDNYEEHLILDRSGLIDLIKI